MKWAFGRRGLILLVILIPLVVVACVFTRLPPNDTEADYDKIQVGMTYEEGREILQKTMRSYPDWNACTLDRQPPGPHWESWVYFEEPSSYFVPPRSIQVWFNRQTEAVETKEIHHPQAFRYWEHWRELATGLCDPS